MGCEMLTPPRGTCLLPVFRCFHISQRQRARANFQGGAEAGLMGCEILTPPRGMFALKDTAEYIIRCCRRRRRVGYYIHSQV